MKKYFLLLCAAAICGGVTLKAQTGLVFKQIYYTGSTTPSGATYFSDQFYEIYNNTADTLYLDSLCLADTYGVSGQINTSSVPTEFQSDVANVVIDNIWMIPGTGRQRPLAPGKSVVIAQDGIDHRSAGGNPGNPVANPNSYDLSAANWETYKTGGNANDTDSPAVPNLVQVHTVSGFDWLTPVFGDGIILFKVPNPSGLATVSPAGQTTVLRKVPVGAVIDAVEALRDGNSSSFKRIPLALDVSFVFASGTYTGQAASRKVAGVSGGRTVLQDTDDSGSDFTVGAPALSVRVEALGGTPKSFALSQNYPNPFNPETAISYELIAASDISLKVFDVLGKEVATLVSGRQIAGQYRVRFNGAGLASGVYFYRLSGSGVVETKKMMLVK